MFVEPHRDAAAPHQADLLLPAAGNLRGDRLGRLCYLIFLRQFLASAGGRHPAHDDVRPDRLQYSLPPLLNAIAAILFDQRRHGFAIDAQHVGQLREQVWVDFAPLFKPLDAIRALGDVAIAQPPGNLGQRQVLLAAHVGKVVGQTAPRLLPD